MLDDFLAPLAFGRGGILTLPVKVTLIDPMVNVALLLRLALLVERH